MIKNMGKLKGLEKVYATLVALIKKNDGKWDDEKLKDVTLSRFQDTLDFPDTPTASRVACQVTTEKESVWEEDVTLTIVWHGVKSLLRIGVLSDGRIWAKIVSFDNDGVIALGKFKNASRIDPSNIEIDAIPEIVWKRDSIKSISYTFEKKENLKVEEPVIILPYLDDLDFS